jgi:ATP-dependent DNA ligase
MCDFLTSCPGQPLDQGVHAHGPHARPRAGPPRRWVYEEKEEKVDGWRFWPTWDGERVRLVSRNGRDHTRRLG